MIIRKVKKNDKVLVITGKDRAKTGKVLKTLPQEGRVLVEGVNFVMRHQRPRKTNEKGSIIKQERPISIANVKIICPQCAKATRIGFVRKDGGKFRVCRKCGAEFK